MENYSKNENGGQGANHSPEKKYNIKPVKSDLNLYALRSEGIDGLYILNEDGHHQVHYEIAQFIHEPVMIAPSNYHRSWDNILDVAYQYFDKYGVYILFEYKNGDVMVSEEDRGVFGPVYGEDYKPPKWIINKNGFHQKFRGELTSRKDFYFLVKPTEDLSVDSLEWLLRFYEIYESGYFREGGQNG